MAWHGFAWYCLVLHGIAWYCMVLHGIALSCTLLHYLALSCAILHYLAVIYPIVPIRYTCSQQMSPATVLDIAVVAEKVKVPY